MTVEIKVVSSPPLRSVLQVVGSQFKKATDLRLAVKFASVVELKRRSDAGEGFDVAILTPELIDALIKDGKIVAKARVNVTRSSLGVVVRAGEHIPAVGSTDITTTRFGDSPSNAVTFPPVAAAPPMARKRPPAALIMA